MEIERDYMAELKEIQDWTIKALLDRCVKKRIITRVSADGYWQEINQ